jgi:hypothetical protein
MIDYEALAIQAKAVCGVAQATVSKIDQLLNSIVASSKTIHTQKMIEYERYLLKEKENIIKKIHAITVKAEEQAKIGKKQMKLGTSEMDIYNHRNDLIHEANLLKEFSNVLTTERIEVLHSFINEELVNIANQASKDLRNAALGVLNIQESILKYIESIEDITLRESVYRVANELQHKNKSFEELLKLGQLRLESITQNLLEKHRQSILEGIRKDMENSRVEQATIEKTISSSASIQDIRSQATNEIIGEEVRKESLKIILKAIESRGFIVDRKNSIKINKDLNVVNVVGKKASGQTAEFKIFLDGRFSYKFDGFEGQSCQKDIEPFMNDLEDIYGMKITGRLELWKNPDKLSSQKYQTYNTNKDKN